MIGNKIVVHTLIMNDNTSSENWHTILSGHGEYSRQWEYMVDKGDLSVLPACVVRRVAVAEQSQTGGVWKEGAGQRYPHCPRLDC